MVMPRTYGYLHKAIDETGKIEIGSSVPIPAASQAVVPHFLANTWVCEHF
jgi:hypothetical protein